MYGGHAHDPGSVQCRKCGYLHKPVTYLEEYQVRQIIKCLSDIILLSHTRKVFGFSSGSLPGFFEDLKLSVGFTLLPVKTCFVLLEITRNKYDCCVSMAQFNYLCSRNTSRYLREPWRMPRMVVWIRLIRFYRKH